MKSTAILLGALVALSGQTPAPHPASHAAAPPARHLVYQFGLNTKGTSSGQGTGTIAIDIKGPAPDGGLVVSGADHWWNTVRAHSLNTCEVYPDGTVKCSKAPYGISIIQVTIFPLLGRNFFKGLNAHGTSAWTQKPTIYAAVIPGATGFPGNPYTWNSVYNLQGKGLAPDSTHIIVVQSNGTLDQQGGHYQSGKLKAGILYDPTVKLPVYVNEERTHYPQRTVYNNDLVQLKLVKDSGLTH